MIYIPLPDYGSRLNIFKANLRKTPIARDIELTYVAQITDGFSGADITEICQRAAKSAVRDAIEAESRLKASIQQNPNFKPADNYDPVPELARKHFEEALKNARRSVKDTVWYLIQDLEKFDQFRRKFDPSYATKSGGAGGFRINWPAGSNQNVFANQNVMEEDLYT